MDEADYNFIGEIYGFVIDKPDLFDEVIGAATRGLKMRCESDRMQAVDMEVAFVNLLMYKTTGHPDFSWEFIAEKLEKHKDNSYFRLDHWLEAVKSGKYKIHEGSKKLEIKGKK